MQNGRADEGPLRGVRVIVAGAGLAGLTCARALAARGADVTVYEARARLGGRVLTARGGPLGTMHGELGGELIEEGHGRVRQLARDLGVPLEPALARGFGLVTLRGRRLHVARSQADDWNALAALLEDDLRRLEEDGASWHGSVARALSTLTVDELLRLRHASPQLRTFTRSLRGLLMAGPDDLSALVLLDLLRTGSPAATATSRVRGGADQLVAALARQAPFRVATGHRVHRVARTGRSATVTLETPSGSRVERRADFVVLALPLPIVRDLQCDPPLPDRQRAALDALSFGVGVKTLLRFESPWWRAIGRPRAYGTTLPIGAVWDAGEHQRGGGLLALLTGAANSRQADALVSHEGRARVLRALRWLGTPEAPIGCVQAHWGRDPWARGAYAVFGPGFDPHDRELLGRAAGRVLFAGEHTSTTAQGYMEGAVESGERAARELEAIHAVRR
jgi:monoamine oxidase